MTAIYMSCHRAVIFRGAGTCFWAEIVAKLLIYRQFVNNTDILY